MKIPNILKLPLGVAIIGVAAAFIVPQLKSHSDEVRASQSADKAGATDKSSAASTKQIKARE